MLQNDKIKALCSGVLYRREAGISSCEPAGHRVFDTVSPVPDYIEAKSKTEQLAESG